MAIPEKVLGKLIDAAKSASEHAYSPYSKFRVGAAVLTMSGEIFSGCNVENASYGLTICAERNAIFHSVFRGQTRLKAVVVYTPTKTPSAPCGACRQVINEFGPEAEIISVCDGPDTLNKTLAELMPDAFGPHNLKWTAFRDQMEHASLARFFAEAEDHSEHAPIFASRRPFERSRISFGCASAPRAV
jgi:cytidine deaminase